MPTITLKNPIEGIQHFWNVLEMKLSLHPLSAQVQLECFKTNPTSTVRAAHLSCLEAALPWHMHCSLCSHSSGKCSHSSSRRDALYLGAACIHTTGITTPPQSAKLQKCWVVLRRFKLSSGWSSPMYRWSLGSQPGAAADPLVVQYFANTRPCPFSCF